MGITIRLSLRFLYIFDRSGLLCAVLLCSLQVSLKLGFLNASLKLGAFLKLLSIYDQAKQIDTPFEENNAKETQ